MVSTYFDPYRAWEEYQLLEEDFLRALRFVPLTDAHYQVWSSPFSNLIINIGSLVDSFFKNILMEDPVNAAPDIKKGGRSNWINMGHYRKTFDPDYDLSKQGIFELQNFSFIKPYAAWACDSTNTWWKAYTDIKHDRFKNKEEATQRNVLEALGALFLLNVNFIESIPALIDKGVIHGGSLTRGYLKEILSAKGVENRLFEQRIYAKTSLFGYVYDTKVRMFSEDEKKWILSPSYSGY